MDAALAIQQTAPALPALGAIATALGAYASGALASIGAALAAIPVVGWIILAVAVVAILVVVFWDEICEFFSAIWDWLCGAANIVYDWVVTTAIPIVVDTATDILNAIEVEAERINRARDIAEALILTAAASKVIKYLDNVYEIIVWKPDRYFNFNFGGKKVYLKLPQDRNSNTYKYGTTTKAIMGRYASTSYIGYHLIKKNFACCWHYLNVHPLYARAQEKLLIANYAEKHGCFPPGNTKFG